MVDTPLVFGSSNGISFSGLASGLNTSQLISALVSFEGASVKQPLLNKKGNLQAKLSALELLASKFSALKSKAETINETSKFLSNKATSSVSTLLTATASGSALEGSYEITVTQIAQAETKYFATAYPDVDTTSAGTGTLTINYAGEDHVITVSNGSLNGIATAINSASIGVKASVVNASTTGTPSYKLFLQGDDVGEDNAIALTANNLTGGTALGSLTDLVDAQNATFNYGTLTGLSRTSNTVTDLIPGVTIELLKASAGTPVTVTVTKDTAEVADKIEEFVSAFNDAANFLKTHRTYKQGSTPAALFGDLAVNIASSKLSSIVSGVQNAANPDFANLAQIGIKSNVDGTLTIDSSVLEDAIDEDPQAVSKLFATGLSGGGVAVQTEEWLESFLSTANTGLVQAKKDSINATLKDLDEQILKADTRLQKYQDGLTRKYTQLEALMSKLQSQQAFLGAFKF